MYRLTLLLASLVAVTVGSGYVPGRDYVYQYTGRLYTGFPDKKPQYAGIGFTSRFTIQPYPEYVVVKADSIQYDRINTVVEHPREYPFQYRDLPASAEHLYKPFKVYFKNGQVTQFQVSRDEPAYVVNIKRGLISLFHLNLDQVDSFQSADENELFQRDPEAHYYRVHEDGVLGNCETHYVIEHHPYHLAPHNNIVLNITKSKNYHNCLTTPNQVYSTFYGHECGEAEHEKSHTLHGNAYYYYSIRGDRHHYIIEKIRTEGETAYTPYPPEGQTAQVFMERELELIAEEPRKSEFQVSSDVVAYYSLSYDFTHKPDFKDVIDLKKPHYLYHLYGRKFPLNEIRKQFEEVSQVYDDETYSKKIQEKDYPAKFLELVRSVSTLGYEDIEELYNAYAKFPKEAATPEKVRHRSVFYDVLVNVGTNPTVLFGKDLIQRRKVSAEIAVHYYHQLQMHVKEVTEVLLDEIYRSCESAYVKQHQTIHSACYLALSSLVHDHCVARYSPEGGLVKDKSSCPPETASKYFNYIARHFEQTEEEYLKVGYIYAMGNIGDKEGLRYLTPYVEGQGGHNRFYRSLAIWALRNIGYRYPEKVKELLVPLYLNKSENYELRLASFILLMQYNPQLFALETIARSLLTEEDDQVRSYVYSTFKSYENSTHPCNRKFTDYMPYVLRILDRQRDQFEKYDYSYSKHLFVSGYDKDYDYGGSTRFAYFANDNGYIPQSVYLGINDYIGGKSYETFGIGYKQYGLEKFTDKLFGPEGTYGKRSLFDLFKKRTQRDVNNVEKEQREIQEKLQIPTKEYEPIQATVFFKYMGNTLSFLYFNESNFEDFFREGRFNIRNLPAAFRKLPQFHYQRFLLGVDQLYIIPSEAGLPIVFDYKQPTLFYYQNNDLQFQVNPGFFAEDRQGQFPTDVKIRVDGHLAVDKNMYASVGVVIPFDELVFGAGINRRSTLSLPVKVDVTVDLKDTKVSAKWVPVVPHEVYHFHYEPYTFIDSYANHVPVSSEETYLPVRRELYRKQYEREYFHKALGLGFTIKRDYDNEWDDFGSWYRFLTEKTYRQKYYYLLANPQFEPYRYDISLTPAKEDVTTEVEAQFDYSYHGEENRPYTTSHFSEGGFEEYDRSRTNKDLYTSVLRGEIVAKGEKERKVQAEFTYSRNLIRSYHKFNVYYDRTPFLKEETNNFKVCASGYLKYPKYDLSKFATLNTIGLDHTTLLEMKAHFGKDCQSDQKVVVQGRYGYTEEQRYLESKREDEEHKLYNPYASYYQQCIKEKTNEKVLYPEACVDYMHYVTELRQYNYDIKYENLSPRFLNYTYRLGGYFRHLFHDYADHKVYGVENPEGQIQIEANVSALYPVVDIKVKKPRSESHYTHVYMPTFKPLRSYPHYQNAHIIYALHNHYCKIEADNIYTFDRFSYSLPPIECYKVLAKDNSPAESFIVLASKISHPKYREAIKVILGQYKIEALPVSDESDLIVRVDGKKVTVTENEPYFQYISESKTPEFYIIFRDFYYTLKSPKYGLIVEFDGNFAALEVSPYYRSKLTGLCGNYNGQKYDGNEIENGCVIYDTDSYAYRFAIPTETCSVPSVQQHCYGEAGAGCTELRTHVLHITTGKAPQTCFSTEPVAQCRPGCQSTGTVSRKLGYHCLPAKDDSTKNLLRQQQLRVLYEVRRKSKDHESVVEVPERCVRE